MKIPNILRRKNPTSMDSILQNDLCKRTLDKFCQEDLSKTTSLIIIYEVEEQRGKMETYFLHAGVEPAQTILTLAQLLHRIQHEGLANYE